LAVYWNIEDLNFEKTVVTVGSFDGVHCGHKMLLRRMVDLATQHHLRSVVLTFWPHPRQVLNTEDEAPLLLNTLDEKIALLKQTGVDDVVVFSFDKILSQTSASDFVRSIIIEKFDARYLVVGQDHRFGKGRSGNVQQLLKFVSHSDLKMEVVNFEMLNWKISSSAIRKALLCGNLKLANEMLGYKYMISGKVIVGNRLGRTIGFPTANIETSENKLLPKEGVYSVNVKSKIETCEFDRIGMMYIGKRPVLKQEEDTLHVEVNIFDFDQQIYGQEITLELTHRIRDEIKFENVKKLAEQLHNDKQKILFYLKRD